MMRAGLISLFALIASPALAVPDLIGECADLPVGDPPCDAAAIAKTLEVLSPGDFAPFREARMESFAMQYAFGLLRQGVDNRIAGGECIDNAETAYAAGEIWFAYVEPSLSDDMNEEIRARYGEFEGFFNNVLSYVQQGEC